MKNRLFLCLIWASVHTIFLGAQGLKTVRGVAQIEILATSSYEETKAQCIEEAEINAIENTFGRVVVSGSSMFLENVQDGSKVQSASKFVRIGDSFVNGEWIETLSRDCERIRVTPPRNDEIKCLVKGKARALRDDRVELDIRTLDCPDLKCATEVYFDEEEFYLYFKSPLSGYLAVYLSDGQNVFLLLPDRNMEGSTFAVQQDEAYFLFSEHHKSVSHGQQVTEYELTMDDHTQPSELNRLYVLYATHNFGKPGLERPFIKDIPMYIELDKFSRWLAKQRAKNTSLQLNIIDVQIKPQP